MNRTQFGYAPTNFNNTEFNTEFQGNSIGQAPNYQQGQQQNPYGGGYSMPQGQQATGTSYQQYMDQPLDSGAVDQGSYDTTQAALSSVPVVGTVAGTANSLLRNFVGDPLEESSMSINEETGAYDNSKKAQYYSVANQIADPLSATIDSFKSDDKWYETLATASGLGGLFSKSKIEDQEKANMDEVSKAKAEEQAILDKRIADQIRNQRLSSLQQNQPSYGSVFNNGGYMKQYANGGGLKDTAHKAIRDINPTVNTSYDARTNPNSVNYNSMHPFSTTDGSEYYLTPTTTAMQGNPAFTQFNDRYSSFVDPKLISDYGNVRGANYSPETGMSFQADTRGDTSKMRSAYEGKLTPEQLQYNNQYKEGGFMENVENNPNVTYYAGNIKHETSKNGGIPIGSRGLVESGEFKYDFEDGESYIFSNRF